MTTNNNTSGKSALKVKEGVNQPDSVNPLFKQQLKRFKKTKVDIDAMFNGIVAGDRTMLSRAITLIESALPADEQPAQELIQKCLPHSGNSFRIGITGVPGVGKSTFIEAFGLKLIEKGHKVAVLAIDPSSMRTKGSILGDKTRMEQLSQNDNAFIRPSASAGTLGGVARKTRETIILCEAAGFDRVFIETVGVGQSETAVAQMTDFFLLLMLAGSGDELQGIKRGIMEMADLIVINKADGDNIQKAELAKREFKNALHLFPPMENGWLPQVVTASALAGTGLKTVINLTEQFESQVKSNGYFEKNRKSQDLALFEENIRNTLIDRFYQDKKTAQLIELYRKKIAARQKSPYEAAAEILGKYFSQRH